MEHRTLTYTIVLGSLMGLVLSVCMSGIMTWLTLGFADDFWWQWARGFVVSFIISTPLSIIILPALQRMADYICQTR